MVTLHEPVPLHAPLQPLKTCPAAGVAARLTDAPETNVAEQVAPQLMPAGALVTDPVPVPAKEVVNVKSGEKFAVTVAAAFIATVQVPVPEHRPPLQPVNTEPPAAAAVKVTLLPCVKFALHVAPQLIPAGALVTVPDPDPVFDTVIAKVGGGVKVAVTATGAVPIVKVQVPVPEHTPLQPANTDAEDAGEAVSVTTFPVLMALEFVHVPDAAPDVIVQLTPPVPVTLPLPVPAPVTVTVVRLKVAVTDSAALIVTAHAPVPVQAPLQPAKAEPAGALGVKFTVVPVT